MHKQRAIEAIAAMKTQNHNRLNHIEVYVAGFGFRGIQEETKTPETRPQQVLDSTSSRTPIPINHLSSGQNSLSGRDGQKSHTRSAISFHVALHTPEHVAGDHLVPTRLEFANRTRAR